MSKEAFDNFRNLVLEDPSLQQLLRSTPDYDGFAELTIRLSDEHGYSITAEDIESAFFQARTAWWERNLS
jgi:hypothetical protein